MGAGSPSALPGSVCVGTAADGCFCSQRNGRQVGRPRDFVSPGDPSNLFYAVGDPLQRVQKPQCFVTGSQLKNKSDAISGAP